MSVDPAAMPQAGAADPDAGRMGMLSLAIDVVRRPSRAMARIALRPKRRWVAPLLALAIVSVPLAIVNAKHLADAQASAMASVAVAPSSAAGEVSAVDGPGGDAAASQAAAVQAGGILTLIFGAVGAAIGAFMVPLIAAGVLHFLSTILGGQQSFAEMFATASWARIPLILRGVLQLVVFGAGGYDPNPSGLSGLAAPAGFQLGATHSYLEPLLAQVEVWNLWYLMLLVIAVMAVARFPRRRAALVVGGLVGLSIGSAMAGIAINNAMSGLMGG